MAPTETIDISSSDTDATPASPPPLGQPTVPTPANADNHSPEREADEADEADLDLLDGFFDLGDDDDPFDLPVRGPGPPPRALHGFGDIVHLDDQADYFPFEGAQQPSYADGATDQNYAFALPIFSADDCLIRILDIFPDISHDHVKELYHEFERLNETMPLPGPSRVDNIIEKILSTESYPKQPKGNSALKRKRGESEEAENYQCWEKAGREITPSYVTGSIKGILKADFPEIPHVFINRQFAFHRHLFPTYIALANAQDNQDPNKRLFGLGRPSRHWIDSAVIAANSGWPPLPLELNAARNRCASLRKQRAEEEVQKAAEEANLQQAIAAGETAECQACFDTLPMNRQIHCNGVDFHFTCFDCVTTYISSEIGESRCNVQCTAGCGATFRHEQLALLSDKHLIAKLEQLQQEKAVRDADIEDLEECPFCDYKAIPPPIAVDREFRCAKPDCEKISCRLCKAASHVPKTCEEHAKENRINSRHKIEEAMTAALIRSCNKCKKQFIKEQGCNKMSCPSCHNSQCYVCSKDINGSYTHFDMLKKCPLYDNVEERHKKEVEDAEAAARAAIIAENPDVSAEELQIKMSDAVNAAEKLRVAAAGRVMPDVLGHPMNLDDFLAAGDLDMDGVRGHHHARARQHRRHNHARARQYHQQHQLQQHQLQQHLLAQRQLKLGDQNIARTYDLARCQRQNAAQALPNEPPPPPMIKPGAPMVLQGFEGIGPQVGHQLQGYVPIYGMQGPPGPGNAEDQLAPLRPWHGNQIHRKGDHLEELMRGYDNDFTRLDRAGGGIARPTGAVPGEVLGGISPPGPRANRVAEPQDFYPVLAPRRPPVAYQGQFREQDEMARRRQTEAAQREVEDRQRVAREQLELFTRLQMDAQPRWEARNLRQHHDERINAGGDDVIRAGSTSNFAPVRGRLPPLLPRAAGEGRFLAPRDHVSVNELANERPQITFGGIVRAQRTPGVPQFEGAARHQANQGYFEDILGMPNPFAEDDQDGQMGFEPMERDDTQDEGYGW